MIKFILGTIEMNIDGSNIISENKKKLLKKLGVQNYDLSHYRKGNYNRISKEKLKVIRFILTGSDIVNGFEFKPLNKKKKISGTDKVLVIKGF